MKDKGRFTDHTCWGIRKARTYLLSSLTRCHRSLVLTLAANMTDSWVCGLRQYCCACADRLGMWIGRLATTQDGFVCPEKARSNSARSKVLYRTVCLEDRVFFLHVHHCVRVSCQCQSVYTQRASIVAGNQAACGIAQGGTYISQAGWVCLDVNHDGRWGVDGGIG